MTHKICEFYKKIYLLSGKIPKRDRFGIYTKIEKLSLDLIDLSISASLESREKKVPFLNSARIKIEVLKRFFRIAYELKLIEEETYIEIEADLQEFSKMTNGWMKYLRQQ